MKDTLKSNLFWIILIIVAALVVSGYSIYKSRSTKLLDKDVYNEFKSAVDEIADSEAGGFTSQDELSRFITDWADANSLEYKIDKTGNIIFDRESVKRKRNVTPTLVGVSMNFETAASNARLLASAAAIALADFDSGRRTVVFFNDEQNLGNGYKKLSKNYLTDKTKVIFLDSGSSSYLSTASFEERFSYITVPVSTEDNSCDTAVRIKISGIDSGVVGPAIGKQPDPIQAFSTLLTRLKSKSVISRLADVKVGTNGNMYPVSLEATVVLNSYASGSFTSYIEKRIKAWEKSYGKDHEDLVYEYEVIDDPEKLPKTVYSADTTDKLTAVLYTLKTGTYKYTESDPIPEGKKKGDTYGINALLDLETGDNAIRVRLITQGYNDMFTDRIIYDNTAAAELYGCGYKVGKTYPEFINDKNKLSRTFKKTYDKVNDNTTADAGLPYDTDNFFTPCSYMQLRNGKTDIIHIRMNGANASRIANTILCYIKAKGNTSIFS